MPITANQQHDAINRARMAQWPIGLNNYLYSPVLELVDTPETERERERNAEEERYKQRGRQKRKGCRNVKPIQNSSCLWEIKPCTYEAFLKCNNNSVVCVPVCVKCHQIRKLKCEQCA